MVHAAEVLLCRREVLMLSGGEAAPGVSGRACLICGLPLPRGARKVHPGACKRARETALQQKRRQRKRIAR